MPETFMLLLWKLRDGYIFSKSIHGKGLSEKEKQWLLLENDANVYTDYRDKNGKLLFRLKSCVDTFSYKFKESDPETGEEKVDLFSGKRKTHRFLQSFPCPEAESRDHENGGQSHQLYHL